MKKKTVVSAMVMGFALAVTFLFWATVSFAQVTRVITFQFEKPVVEEDLDHFDLQYSTVNPNFATPFDSLATPPAGDWQSFAQIPRNGDETIYTHPEPLETPSGATTEYWFRIRALDHAGNPSVWCYGHDTEGACYFKADNEPPGALIQFKIVIIQTQ